MDYKICIRCHESHQLTNFRKNSSRKDGYSSYCKSCVKASEAIATDRRRNNPPKILETVQKCTGCKIEKNLLEFDVLITGRLGRKSRCKECIHVYNIQYNLTNSEVLRFKGRSIQAEIKEQNLANIQNLYSEDILSQIKMCSRCGISKVKREFGRTISGSEGFKSWCNQCSAEDTKVRYRTDENYRKQSIERSRLRSGTDLEKLQRKERRLAEKIQRSDVYKARIRETQRIRTERINNATPPWADMGKIRQIYREAKRLTKTTGVKYSVDHHYPLAGETVCGLHVEANLKVMPLLENISKFNTEIDIDWVIH